MNKYQKLFKTLFNKYANTIRNHNVEDNFNLKDEKSKYMNMGEIVKFCKDHGLIDSTNFLSRDEIVTLVKLINTKKKKPDGSNLDFEGF
jgi:hypothetical protein